MWQTLAASVTGSYHLKQKKGNEDAYSLASLRATELCLVVSDGAGSASCAAEGSRFLSSKMLELFARCPMPSSRFALECEGLAMLYWLKHELDAFARSKDRPADDFAATLLAVMIGPYNSLALQVGDGAIVAQMASAEIRFLCQPFRGDYASETVFVSSHDALTRASVAVYPSTEISALALLSDGLEPVALQQSKPFAGFFEPIFAFGKNAGNVREKVASLQQFLASERINARTHDDKTLVLATR